MKKDSVPNIPDKPVYNPTDQTITIQSVTDATRYQFFVTDLANNLILEPQFITALAQVRRPIVFPLRTFVRDSVSSDRPAIFFAGKFRACIYPIIADERQDEINVEFVLTAQKAHILNSYLCVQNSSGEMQVSTETMLKFLQKQSEMEREILALKAANTAMKEEQHKLTKAVTEQMTRMANCFKKFRNGLDKQD